MAYEKQIEDKNKFYVYLSSEHALVKKKNRKKYVYVYIYLYIYIYIYEWIVPLWINTFLPSNTLARLSLIVDKDHQNGRERKSSKLFLGAIDFPFESEEFLTFQESNNEFRDPENIEIDKLHGKIHVFVRSFASPQLTVKCDKSESLGTPDAHMGSCAA